MANERDRRGRPMHAMRRRALGPSGHPPRRHARRARLFLAAGMVSLLVAAFGPPQTDPEKRGRSEVPHRYDQAAATFYPLRGNCLESGAVIHPNPNRPRRSSPGRATRSFCGRLRPREPSAAAGSSRARAADKGQSARRLRRHPSAGRSFLDERRFVEYAVRTAESLAADAPHLAERTKVPRSRLQKS